MVPTRRMPIWEEKGAGDIPVWRTGKDKKGQQKNLPSREKREKKVVPKRIGQGSACNFSTEENFFVRRKVVR